MQSSDTECNHCPFRHQDGGLPVRASALGEHSVFVGYPGIRREYRMEAQGYINGDGQHSYTKYELDAADKDER